MPTPLALPFVLAVASVLSVLAALLIAAALDRRRCAPGGGGTGQSGAVFLVGDGSVLDSNDAGLSLLATLAGQDRAQAGAADPAAALPGPAASWMRLQRHLAARFPGLAERLADPGGESWQIAAQDGSGLVLDGTVCGGTLRLVLRDGAAAGADDADAEVRIDQLSWRALNDELDALRRASDLAPVPSWRETPDGRIVWANGAYLRLLAECGQSDPLGWPFPALFSADRTGGRQGLTIGASGRQRWFDLAVVEDGGARLVFALPADEAQKAERARRDFVQTLSRTFATLPVGLAVFDRARRLQLFNPALADLTGLEPEFLASRPGLEGVLNRMRDKHVMPEPRDYRAWTRRLLDVEAVVTGAGFEEIWALPDGRSFRVSAAPHPDGALAILIEDVTSDIRLKRSYRAEVDTGRAALDLVEDAVAVFGPGGDLVLTNAAFDRTWQLEGADSLAGVSLAEAVANWRLAGGEPELWDRIVALAGPAPAAPEVRGRMRLEDGEVLAIRARRSPGGGVILAFTSPVSGVGPMARAPEMRRASA